MKNISLLIVPSCEGKNQMLGPHAMETCYKDIDVLWYTHLDITRSHQVTLRDKIKYENGTI